MVSAVRFTATHYPSWGLETIDPVPEIWRRVDSLPLMGIGNPRVARQGAPVLDLITPHGDWKPACGASGRSCARSHYPSWGLETDRPAGLSHATSSHYPSWGLETSTRTRIARSQSSDSLPLMGIGNSHGAPEIRDIAVHIADLITPHGDWKHSAKGRPYRPRYSLPLMGIGNLKACEASRRESSSLPLMGIGNHCRRRPAQGTTPTLITPHGDWKLELLKS